LESASFQKDDHLTGSNSFRLQIASCIDIDFLPGLASRLRFADLIY